MYEARQLPTSAQPVRGIQLSSEVGSSSPFVWGDTETRDDSQWETFESQGWHWSPQRVEVSALCAGFVIWILDFARDPDGRPWLLYAQEETTGGVRLSLQVPASECLETEVAPGMDLYGAECGDSEDRRVVKIEYECHKEFASEATLYSWTQGVLQDYDHRIAEGILQIIRDTKGGRFLRLLRRSNARPSVHGRVQGAEADPVAQPVFGRQLDDPSQEGVSVHQDAQPPCDNHVELPSGTVLRRSSRKRSQQARYTPESSRGHRVAPALRQSWASACARPDRGDLQCHETLEAMDS